MHSVFGWAYTTNGVNTVRVHGARPGGTGLVLPGLTPSTVANLTLVAGKSGCQAVPVAAQKATASSSMMSALLSPMLRPISARSGSDNYGP